MTDAIQAEAVLLGGLLRHPDALGDVAQMLRATDFALPEHAHVFAAILHLWTAGKPVAFPAVALLLRERQQIAGGSDPKDGFTVGCLRQLIEAGTLGAHAYYAEIVAGAALLRRLETAAGTILADVQARNGSPAELLERAERAIFATTQTTRDTTVKVADAVNAALAAIDERSVGQRSAGLPTGFEALDKLLVGLQPAELVIVAARPSVGKTTFAAALFRALYRQDVPALFCSLEQASTEIAERLLAAEARVDSHRLRLPAQMARDGSDLASLMTGARALKQGSAWIADAPHQTVLHIATNARRLKMRHGLGCLLIDYIGLVEPEDRKAPRHEQVGLIARRLKALAKELGIPVVCLAQLNRQVENRPAGEPRLADLRDSGEIEQHADVVILLHRPEAAMGTAQTLGVHVAKNRNGRTGVAALRHIRAQMRFESIEPPRSSFEGGES